MSRLRRLVRDHLRWYHVLALGVGLPLLYVVYSSGRLLPRDPAAPPGASAPSGPRIAPRELYRQTMALASEVRAFVYEREGGETPVGKRQEGDAEAVQDLYAGRFRAKVLALREEFRKHGLTDEGLDRHAAGAHTLEEIRTVCLRLEALARNLVYEVR